MRIPLYQCYSFGGFMFKGLCLLTCMAHTLVPMLIQVLVRWDSMIVLEGCIACENSDFHQFWVLISSKYDAHASSTTTFTRFLQIKKVEIMIIIMKKKIDILPCLIHCVSSTWVTITSCAI